MRWPKADKRARTRRGFLLFPKCIGKEWRWLEYAAWREQYATGMFGVGWCATEWVAA